MNNMFLYTVFMALCCTVSVPVIAVGAVQNDTADSTGIAEKLSLTIEDALALGREQSIASKENDNTLLKAEWRYRNYKAGLLPNITIGGTLPSLNRLHAALPDFIKCITPSRNLMNMPMATNREAI